MVISRPWKVIGKEKKIPKSVGKVMEI